MQLKITSISSVARSFIVVVAMCAASFYCASSASADISGAVLAWGDNDNGQCAPMYNSAKNGVSAIAGGYGHTIAIKNGVVLAWGLNGKGQCTIPATADSGVSAIAGGWYHTIALKGGTDCNVDSISDTVEIAQDPTLDRNLNGELDSCEIAADPTLDRNSNGIIDLVEIAALTAQLNCGDLDGDGEVNGADIGLMLVSYGPCAP